MVRVTVVGSGRATFPPTYCRTTSDPDVTPRSRTVAPPRRSKRMVRAEAVAPGRPSGPGARRRPALPPHRPGRVLRRSPAHRGTPAGRPRPAARLRPPGPGVRTRRSTRRRPPAHARRPGRRTSTWSPPPGWSEPNCALCRSRVRYRSVLRRRPLHCAPFHRIAGSCRCPGPRSRTPCSREASHHESRRSPQRSPWPASSSCLASHRPTRLRVPNSSLVFARPGPERAGSA